MIKNIIWDAGGTLFDTYPAMTAAFLSALEERGIHAPAEWVRDLAQVSQKYCILVLSARYQLDEKGFTARYKTFLKAAPPSEMPPFPGVIAVCQAVCDHGGKNLIATHRERESVEQLLAAHHMQAYFAGCLTTSDGYPRKPDPAMLNALVRQYQLERSQTLVIGDRVLDIEAGQAAGMPTCLFGTRGGQVPADIQISSFTELLQKLPVL